MNLSQDEINALLGGEASPSDPEPDPGAQVTLEALTPQEIDTLGEVGNICMGAVATAMYMLLERRVEITTPRVDVLPIKDVLSRFPVPVVLVEVEYVEGITGRNMLLLKEYDTALITDLLMGGEGVVEEPIELSELHMSAINEIMNQMTGASATSLSQLIGRLVNISTPQSYHISSPEDILKLGNDETVIIITFDMEIEGLLKSQLVQFMPYDVGRDMSHMLTHRSQAPQPVLPQPAPAAPAVSPYSGQVPVPPQVPLYPTGFERPEPPVPGELIDVRPLQFHSFDEVEKTVAATPSGIESIYNIPLTVAAELGTTSKNLSDVLEFQPGIVFMLEKAAGDPVEVLVNGKRIARGEVVIIDDNYGVRITDLPEN